MIYYVILYAWADLIEVLHATPVLIAFFHFSMFNPRFSCSAIFCAGNMCVHYCYSIFFLFCSSPVDGPPLQHSEQLYPACP